MFNIEKDVPVPLKNWKALGYPFLEMEVGDSFVFDICKRDELYYVAYKSQCVFAPNYRKQGARVFMTRKIDCDVGRCWRLE